MSTELCQPIDTRPVTIYALSDPRKPSLIRYIGKTRNTLRERRSSHVNPCGHKKSPNCHKVRWIKKVLSEGFIPIIWPLEICSQYNWKERETFWIKFFKPLGLCNQTNGGEDWGYFRKPKKPRTTKYKVTISEKRRQFLRNLMITKVRPLGTTPEARIKGGLKRRMRIQPEKSVHRHREIMKNKPARTWTEEQKQAASQKQKAITAKLGQQRPHIKCLCVELNKEFPSVAAASRFINRRPFAIFDAMKSGTLSGGYHWRKINV